MVKENLKELKLAVSVLESKVALLTEKVNEVVSCLTENRVSRKIPVELLDVEEEEEDEEEEAEEEEDEE